MKKYTTMTVAALAEALRKREISACEVTEAYLSSIGERDGAINAYITVTETLARANAVSADAMLAAGEGDVLCGVPCSVKDNITVKGYPTTCASAMLRDFVPPYSASVCEKLWSAGAVILGKTNMDEFAMGSSSEKSVFGAVHNPLDLTRSAGGSSGGAAASVAAGEAAFALGSDTGGSARQPASFCGLVAMKPTYGLVSRYGLVETASSLEQICPITRTVSDNLLVLRAIMGKDPHDMTTLEEYAIAPDAAEVKGLRIGVFAGYDAHCSVGVTRCVDRAVGKMTGLGVLCETVSLPSPELARDIYLITMAAEASSNLARYDGIKYGHGGADVISSRSEGFGEEVRRRIVTGSYALSSVYKGDYYRKIKTAQRELCRRMEEIFASYDMILMPTVGTTAFSLASHDSTPAAMYDSDIFTVYANLTGCPAITVPAGGEDGMPVGVTLMGHHRGEGLLYAAAEALENELRQEIEGEVKKG